MATLLIAQNPLQEHFVDAPTEPLAAVDLNNGYAFVIPIPQRGIGVDIDQLGRQAIADEQRDGVIA